MRRKKKTAQVEEALGWDDGMPAWTVAGGGVGERVEQIRNGLSMRLFFSLQKELGLSADRLAGYLAISRSTLARRKKAGRLDMLESDRLVRFARLFEQSREVLGDRERARDWLSTPAPSLGFATPLAYAETELGAREVEALLGRIEHGVFS